MMKLDFKHTFNLFFILLTLFGLSGCGATSAAIMDKEEVNNRKPMASYKSFLIKTFTLKRELVTTLPDKQIGEREKRYLAMPEEIAEKIAKRVEEQHIFSSVIRNGDSTPRTVILSGEFDRISRFRVSLTGKLTDGENNAEIAKFHINLWDIYDTSKTVELISKETADFIDRIQYK